MRLGYPRFSLRTLLIATALCGAAIPTLVAEYRSRLNDEGFVVFGDASKPSDKETRAAFRDNGYALPSEPSRFYHEKIADYCTSPRQVPALGIFRRRHKHYRCGLSVPKNQPTSATLVVKRSEIVWLR